MIDIFPEVLQPVKHLIKEYLRIHIDPLELLYDPEVNDSEKIDFDEASEAWQLNKKKIGQHFRYICTYVSTKTKKRCPKMIMLPSEIDVSHGCMYVSPYFCKHHVRQKYIPEKHLWT